MRETGKPSRVAKSFVAMVRAFFHDLRNVDVDEVGQSMFKHCTSPKALYVTLFERWWVVAACAFVGACLGIVLVKTAEEKYESRGSILLYQKAPTFLDNTMALPDPKAYDSLFATHVQLIGSSLIVEKAVEESGLEESCPQIFDELNEDEHETFEMYVRKNLKVRRAGSGDSEGAFVVNVGFGHTNPEECKTVVNSILETYQAYANESLLFDQRRAFELVNRSKKELQEEVDWNKKTLRDFLKNAPGIWNRETESNPHQLRVQELEDELGTLEIDRLSLASRLESMKLTHDKNTGEVLSDIARLALIDEKDVERMKMLTGLKATERQELYPRLQEIESAKFDKLAIMYVERAKIGQFLGNDHPRVTDLEEQISEMQKQINGETNSTNTQEGTAPAAANIVRAYVRMLEKEYNDVVLKIKFMQGKISEETQRARELTDFAINAKHLQSEYETSLQMYETIVGNATKQSLLQEYGNFISEIVMRPEKTELTWPKAPVMLGSSTILGIFVGSFLALALDLIAYTPLRSAFWFIPNWVLGGDSVVETREENVQSPIEETAEMETLEREEECTLSP